MKKRDKDDLGLLLTREMVAMLRDESMSEAQRFQVLMGIIDGRKLSGLLKSMANMLAVGYKNANGKRMENIEKRRESNRNAQAKYKEKISADKHSSALIGNHQQTQAPISADKPHILGLCKRKRNVNDNPPLSPLGGEGIGDAALEVFKGVPGMENLKSAGKVRKAVLAATAAMDGEELAEFKAQLMAWAYKWQSEDYEFAPMAQNLPRWIKSGKWQHEAKIKKDGAAENRVQECGVMMA